MPRKQVLFRSAAREKSLQGATLLADAVRITLGPSFGIAAACDANLVHHIVDAENAPSIVLGALALGFGRY
jgi:hypothetical protein